MIQKKTLIGGLLAVGLCPLIATAQDGKSGQEPMPGARAGSQPGVGLEDKNKHMNQGLKLQRSDKLIGMELKDRAGEKLGRVEDLVLKPNGEIAYVVVSGNTPETMAKQIVLPWRSVKVEMTGAADRRGDPMAGIDRSTGTDHLVLQAEKDRFATAPSFDRTSWPRAGDTTVYTESDRFFGSAVAGTPDARSGRPVEAGATNPTLFRLSQVRNQQVTDAAGMPAGTISQVVVDPVSGRVNYIAFATTSTAGAPARTVALPWESMQATRRDEKDAFQVRVQPDRLQSAPEFIGGEEGWKRMSDPTYVREVYTHYSVRPYWNDAGQSPNRNPDTNPDRDGKGRKDEPRNPDRDAPKREKPDNRGGNDGRTPPPKN